MFLLSIGEIDVNERSSVGGFSLLAGGEGGGDAGSGSAPTWSRNSITPPTGVIVLQKQGTKRFTPADLAAVTRLSSLGMDMESIALMTVSMPLSRGTRSLVEPWMSPMCSVTPRS